MSTIPLSEVDRALGGYIPHSWRRRIFGTESCRVFIHLYPDTAAGRRFATLSGREGFLRVEVA